MEEEDLEYVLDVNKASVEDLERLPGIGRLKAISIIEYRDSLGEISSLDGLSSIPGITKKLLATLKKRLSCSDSHLLRSCSSSSGTKLIGKISRKVADNNRSSIPNCMSRIKLNKRKMAVSDSPTGESKTGSTCEKKSKLCTLAQQEPNILAEEQFKNSLPRLSCASPGDVVRRRLHPSLSSPPSELSSWLFTFGSWTSDERLSALDSLVELCDMSLIRHLMARIEPQFQRDFISLLPKELALYVLSFLEPKDLCRAAQTCRYWRILAEDNLLWREKCLEYDISEESEEEPLLKTAKKRISPNSSTKIEDIVNTGCPFKKLFIRRHQIELNWRSKEVRPPKLLKGHDDHVITCLQFDGVRIVSGSDDNTLKVWSAVTGKIIRTLQGHTGGVWSSQLKGNIVVSGSTDRTLRVWNADTGECVYVLYGHTSTVRCLAMHENTVVSGSRDGTLRVWDITNGVCLHVLVGHAAAVRCVQYDGRRVVSGAYDYLVKVWDPETESCLHTLSGHSNRVYSLQFDGTYIVSGSLDTSIRVWNAESGQVMHTLLGHQSLTSGMVLKNNILVSGNADSTVKVWDIITGQCLYTLAGPNKHQSAVTSLQFNCKFVVTSSDDGSVKLWDLRTGDFIRDLVKLDSGGSGGVVWRVKCNDKKLVCAVGSRNGTEETKLLVLDFDVSN